MLHVSTIVFTVLLLLSTPLFTALAKDNSSSQLSTNKVEKTPTPVSSSQLYRSCKESIDDKTFDHSFCSEFIRSAFIGFSAITQIIHPIGKEKCFKERQTTIQQLQWLNYLPESVDIREIARTYLRNKDLLKELPSKQSEALQQYLVDDDEIEIARSIASYKSFKTIFLNKKIEKALTQAPASVSSYDLYKSCQEFQNSYKKTDNLTLCSAVISGLWVGYALAKYDLPSYPPDTQCAKGLNRIVNDFTRRFSGDTACSRSSRMSNQKTASKYLSSIDQKSPIGILHVGNENPHFQMIRVISSQCQGR